MTWFKLGGAVGAIAGLIAAFLLLRIGDPVWFALLIVFAGALGIGMVLATLGWFGLRPSAILGGFGFTGGVIYVGIISLTTPTSDGWGDLALAISIILGIPILTFIGVVIGGGWSLVRSLMGDGD